MATTNLVAPEPDRISELDALRGLWAAAVMLYHYTLGFQSLFGDIAAPSIEFRWGFYGVQAFFAVSGFVILMTLERTRRASDFVVSRFSRLFPAYWAAIIATFLIVRLAGPDLFQVSDSAALGNLTMLQGFAGLAHVDSSYWTLTIELIFYAAMLAFWRLNLLKRIEWVIIAWIGISFAAQTFVPEAIRFLLIGEHIPFFAIGILAYRLFAGERTLLQQAPAIAIAYLSVAAATGGETSLIFAAIVAIMVMLAEGRLRFLRIRPLLLLGAISYPLYLVHQFIGVTIILRMTESGIAPDWAMLTAITAVLGIATLIHLAVEKPALKAIRSAWKARSPKLLAPAAAQ